MTVHRMGEPGKSPRVLVYEPRPALLFSVRCPEGAHVAELKKFGDLVAELVADLIADEADDGGAR